MYHARLQQTVRSRKLFDIWYSTYCITTVAVAVVADISKESCSHLYDSFAQMRIILHLHLAIYRQVLTILYQTSEILVFDCEECEAGKYGA